MQPSPTVPPPTFVVINSQQLVSQEESSIWCWCCRLWGWWPLAATAFCLQLITEVPD